jgi:hypothetical protein
VCPVLAGIVGGGSAVTWLSGVVDDVGITHHWALRSFAMGRERYVAWAFRSFAILHARSSWVCKRGEQDGEAMTGWPLTIQQRPCCGMGAGCVSCVFPWALVASRVFSRVRCAHWYVNELLAKGGGTAMWAHSPIRQHP